MKKLIFSLLITIVCSTITAYNGKNVRSVQYDLQTGQLSWTEKFSEQLSWNREAEHDYHVQTPWFDNKKLEINVSQLAHTLGILWSIKSMNPRWEHRILPRGGPVIDVLDLNIIGNVPVFLFCTYRFIAGQQKWPFKIVK